MRTRTRAEEVSKEVKTYATLFNVSLCAVLLVSPLAESAGAQSRSRFLFDDFSYSNQKGLTRNGWIVRTAPGWPG
ncbi:MAG: hypothetical protein QOJ70_2937, partial [Acidobacteriota bacterium]|nr:hypothetical protein [Acidobacteriota bacterium]